MADRSGRFGHASASASAPSSAPHSPRPTQNTTAFMKKRPIHEREAVRESFLEDLEEELIEGDFKSNWSQTMVCTLGFCNWIMQDGGPKSDCKCDNTQMNKSLPVEAAVPDDRKRAV